MTKEEKIREICQNSIQSLGHPLANAIADAITEGYKLGWEECMNKNVLSEEDKRMVERLIRHCEKEHEEGEPADLVRRDFIPYYRKLGRDKFLEVLETNPTSTDEKLKAIYKEMTSKPKKVKQQPNLFEEENV